MPDEKAARETRIESVKEWEEESMYLEVKNLKKSYGDDGSYMEVLKGVDLSVKKGDMCVIQGTSGSGKSTLLNCIGGLDATDSGSISVNGKEIAGMSSEQLSDYQRENLGLVKQTEISYFTRMAMVFQACRNSSAELLRRGTSCGKSMLPDNYHENEYFHQRYLTHLITELKPVLTEIIKQGNDNGDIHFDHPAALAEIVLIVLSVKMDNTIVPSSPEEIEETIRGLISLLEKGTVNPPGSLNFLSAL